MGFVGELMDNKGISGYYVAGLLIFLTLFVIIMIRTIRMPKAALVKYKTDILEEDEVENNININKIK